MSFSLSRDLKHRFEECWRAYCKINQT